MPTVPPKVFLSYSWDSHDHRRWVRDFAARLRADGVEAVLDQWHAVPGDQLPVFMETAVRESLFVLLVCTPNYKLKSDERRGGVGYEGDIMTAEVFTGTERRKFIPLLRAGDWLSAGPSWVLGTYYLDLRGDAYSEERYRDLLDVIHGRREQPPPVGFAPPADSLPRAFDDLAERHVLFARRGERRTAWPQNCVFVELPNGDIVAFKALEYATMQQFIDDLYTNYLVANFALASYGRNWILIGRQTARIAVPLGWVTRLTAHSLRENDPAWAAVPLNTFGIECALALHEEVVTRASSPDWWFANDRAKAETIERLKQVGSFWYVSSTEPAACFGLMTDTSHVIDTFRWGETHPFKTLPYLLRDSLCIAAIGAVAPGTYKFEAVFSADLFHWERGDLGGKVLIDQPA